MDPVIHADMPLLSASRSVPSIWRRRVLALVAALLCHSTFVVAIVAIAVGLYSGMTIGLSRLTGSAGVVCNLLLALQFPLLHSYLLTTRGRAALNRVFGSRHGKDLAPTTYAWIASTQILATFVLWSPSGVVWLAPHGAGLWCMNTAYVLSWAFLLKALRDGDLRLQTGLIGWTAVWQGRRVEFPPMAQRGLFAICRQPIYLGFALLLWTAPVWTPDRLTLALIWSAYCVLGPLHKERRYAKIYGEQFAAYRRAVPYMLPRRSA